MTMAVPVLLVVAWGALAFGGVYDWAYGPLLASCATVGVWGLWRRVPRVRKRSGVALLIGLLLVAAAIGVQLIPVERATLLRVSPATDDFLRQYDVGYAIRVVMETRAAASRREQSSEFRIRNSTPSVQNPQPGTPNPGPGTQSPEPRTQNPRPTPQNPGPITHPLSINPDKTLLGLAFVIGFGLFLLGLQRGLDGWDLRALAPGLTLLGVLIALIAIVQKALWNGKVYGFWEPETAGTTAFGPFINRNHFAGWMLLALPVVIGYFASQVAKGMVGISPGWRSRVAWFSTRDASRAVLTGFSVLVMGFALTLTLSRSGISCFLLAILLSGVNVLRRQAATTKGRLLAAYLVVVFVAAVSWTGIDAIGQRFDRVDWQLGGRAGAWEDAWRIHQMFPWYGTGFNTYGTATTLLQRYEVDKVHYAEAHNDYAQILTEGGYLVAAPAALLIVLFVWQVSARFRERHDDRTSYWLRLGAVTGILAMALQEIVDFSLQMPGNAALFVVLCAVAVRRTSPKHRPTRLDDGPSLAALALVVSCALAAGACHRGPDDAPSVQAEYAKDSGKLILLTYDTNKDTKTDVWSHMDGARLVRMDIDKNFDGVVDRWEYYTPDGALDKVGFSRSGDGRVDGWAFAAADGGVDRVEISTRRDDRVTRTEYFDHGTIARAEEDTDADGRVDRWEAYHEGALASVSLDTQKRGTPDRRLVYAADGVSVEKIAARN